MVAQRVEKSSRKQGWGEGYKSHFKDVPSTYEGKEAEGKGWTKSREE